MSLAMSLEPSKKKISHEQFEKFIVYFTFFYVTAFSVNALLRGNIEFIYYTGLMLLSMTIILMIHKRFHFYPVVLLGLSLLGLLHLLGGNVILGEVRLYDLYFIDGLFKYDNFVHMVGSGIMVMLAYAILKPTLADDFRNKDLYFMLLLVLLGMGLGAMNEMMEFIAVLLFDVAEQVGGYTNTLLDLIYNTIGSIIMAIILVKSKTPLVEPRYMRVSNHLKK